VLVSFHMAERPADICDGTLTVRRARNGRTQVVSLCGELDLANAATAEIELNDALDTAEREVVVDLRELEFIDSTGIALLVAALRRDNGSTRLCFVPDKSPAVTRVLQLTGIDERLPLAAEPVTGGNS
jgi:anti-sigma B factor antagonist